MKLFATRQGHSGRLVRSLAVTFAASALLSGVVMAATTLPASAHTPTPVMTDTPSSGAVGIGGQIFDTATVSGVDTPKGTVLFALYKPEDVACDLLSKPVYTDSVKLGPSGTVTSGDYTVKNPPGYVTYTWVVFYSGDPNNASNSTTCASGMVTISKAIPTLTTTPSASVTVGGKVFDSVVTHAGDHPTGTVTFKLYGPGDPNCTGSSAKDTETLHAGTATSAKFTVTEAGTYDFEVTYNGDSNNRSVTKPCGGGNADPETVVVTKATPTLTTTCETAVCPDPLDLQFADNAVVTGTAHPSGTVDFSLYYEGTGSPTDPTCANSGLVLFQGSQTLVGGTVTSSSYDGPSSSGPPAGLYYWVADYSGDTNNASVQNACGSETVEVGKATPTVTTELSNPSVVVNSGTTTDTATVTGNDPTGSVTFDVFGITDTTCSLAPVSTFADVPLVNGSATSPSTFFTTPGQYQWVAFYNGDSNNKTARSSCGSEDLTVTKASPTITTNTPANEGLNDAAGDTATMVGGDGPTGTVTFTLYYDGLTAPTTPVCSGGNVDVETDTLNSGIASTLPYQYQADGYYEWVAKYNGDGNNNSSAATTCGAEQVVVSG
jgi:hypothetical protein